MGFSRRVAISVHAGCSAAPILVVCVALGPARAVGVMSLMYPLLPRDFGRPRYPSPGLRIRPARRPACVGTPRVGRRASGIRAQAAIQRRHNKELGTAAQPTKQRGVTCPTTPSPRRPVLPGPGETGSRHAFRSPKAKGSPTTKSNKR